MPLATPVISHELPFYSSPDDSPGKTRILTAALALFARDGLVAASIRDIAKKAGVTNPALFKHFRSKDELARFLFQRCYLDLEHRVAAALARGGTFAEQQRAIIDGYLDALERNADSVLYVQDTLRHFWPTMPASVRRCSIVGDIRGFLERGRAARKVTRAVDLELLTVAWIGTLQQIARAKYFGDFKQPNDQLAASVDSLLTKLISP